MPRRMLVVMNPSAHDFEAKSRWPTLEPILKQHADVTLLQTVPVNEETIKLVAQAAKNGFDRVVAIGGDGTVHLVCEGLLGAALPALPEFGVIPFGTANNVAKSLGLPLDDLAGMARIAAGEKKRGLDVCTLHMERPDARENHVWVNCVGIGMDADVLVSRQRYRALGSYTSYAAALAERMLEQRSLDLALTIDGTKSHERVFNVVVTNVPLYAGALAMPNARMDDGLLDIYLFDRNEYGSKVLSYVLKQADILNVGVADILDDITRNEREHHGREVHLHLAFPREIQVDGEAMGEATDLRMSVAAQLQTACP